MPVPKALEKTYPLRQDGKREEMGNCDKYIMKNAMKMFQEERKMRTMGGKGVKNGTCSGNFPIFRAYFCKGRQQFPQGLFIKI